MTGVKRYANDVCFVTDVRVLSLMQEMSEASKLLLSTPSACLSISDLDISAWICRAGCAVAIRRFVLR